MIVPNGKILTCQLEEESECTLAVYDDSFVCLFVASFLLQEELFTL